MDHRLYTGSQCAAIDARAVRHWGFAAAQLMQQAGAAAFAALTRRWPQARRLCVCAGVGNNAGDAYVVAELAARQGLAVTVLQLEGRTLTGIAGAAQARAVAAGAAVQALQAAADGAESLATADVIVDGLLGIGLRSAPRALFAAVIDAINACPAPVLALDVPSGLNADASAPFEAAVAATLTVTFLVDKIALRTGPGRVLAGAVQVAALGLPARLLAEQQGLPQVPFASSALPPLHAGSYKHGRGHVVVVGGDHGMSGAVLLTARAALRAGAGLVSVITRGAQISGLLAQCPELMVVDAARWPAAQAVLQRATVVVCGPGLGQGAWGRTLFAAVLALQCARVLDADALNLLAQRAPAPQLGNAVLTPHSGEAARLLGSDSRTIDADRVASAARLAARYAACAVLKGPGTLVATVAGDEQQVSLCPHGNPGMATAGMGDVLAGVIGAVVAQDLAAARSGDHRATIPRQRVAQAVAWHGAAADAAAQRWGERSLMASDVIAALPAMLRPHALADEALT